MRLHGRCRRPLLSRRRNPHADRARSVVRPGEEPRDVPPSPCPEAAGLTVQPLRSPWETKGRDRGDDGPVSVLGAGGQGTPRLRGRRRRPPGAVRHEDRKSTRLNSSHTVISYAVFCLKKKNKKKETHI